MAWVADSFEIDAGATFTRQYEVKNDDGTVYPLTGFTAKAQVREDAAATLLFESTPTINTTTGVVTLTWTAAQTALLTKVLYNWAMEITDGTTVIRLAEGVLNVSLEIVK